MSEDIPFDKKRLIAPILIISAVFVTLVCIFTEKQKKGAS